MADQVDSTSTEAAMLFSDPSGPNFSWVRRFLELVRFSHTIFALPFAILACVFALQVPGRTELSAGGVTLRLIGVLLCMVFARSAAMALNRLADAAFDARNPRTASRHIPAGLLTARQVWWFFGFACAGFLAACLLFLPNWLPIAFALPVLAWLCGYSYAKRFTAAAHLWLGAALALSPICAWVAIRGEDVLANPADVLPACVLAAAIACWVAGFDIIYACQDVEFDRASGLHSIPARLGVRGALRLAVCLHILMLLILAMLPVLFPELSLGWIYACGLSVVGLLIIWQHSIIRPEDLNRVNIAFFNINALISFGLCSVAAADAWLR